MRLDSSVDEAEALRYLGYAGQQLDGSLMVRFHDAAHKVNALRSVGMFQAFPIECFLNDEEGVPCGVRLQGTPFVLPGRDIAAHVRGAIEVALMAVTLGAESEMLLRRETALSKTDGMLAHACASSLVEGAANSLSAKVEAYAQERGLASGDRFSPGYGDFPLSSQRDFCQALGTQKALGLCVTEANLLVPSKSITAVCGLFAQNRTAASPCEADERADAFCACESCPSEGNCAFRAEGRTCYGS